MTLIPRTGANIEVFYGDDVLAKSFGMHPADIGGLVVQLVAQHAGSFTIRHLAHRNFVLNHAAKSNRGYQ